MRRSLYRCFPLGLRFRASLHALVPDEIQGTVANRLKQISLCGSAFDERLATAPELEHDILHDLFSYRACSNDRLRGTNERRIPAAENRIERCLVPTPKALEKIVGIQAVDQCPLKLPSDGYGYRVPG